MRLSLSGRKQNYFREKLARRRLKFLNRRPRSCWLKKGRTDLWWENMWNGTAPVEHWKKNFRMPRESFMDLLAGLNLYISPNRSSPNYRALSAEKKLALTFIFFKRYRLSRNDSKYIWSCYKHCFSCHN